MKFVQVLFAVIEMKNFSVVTALTRAIFTDHQSHTISHAVA